MIENTLISIVVPTYNRSEMLRRALKSLICQDTDGLFSYEIIVIDDGSTDTTSQVVSKVADFSQVPLKYKRDQGKGYTQALNTGVNEASGKWIAFFDDDQLAEADWLKKLFDITLQMGADFVGGAILLDLPQEHLSHLGPVCRSHLGERPFYDKPVRCKGKVIPPGGNRLVSRKIFDTIGLFDTSMVTGGCDRDHFIRASAAGFSIWVTKNAVVHHVVPLYRLGRDYFLWLCLRQGCDSAYTDRKRLDWRIMLLKCIAKIGQSILVNIPYLLFAFLKRDKAEILDRKCLLWRAMGYTRKTLFVLAPKLFQQERFFAGLDFHKEREIFLNDNKFTENINL